MTVNDWFAQAMALPVPKGHVRLWRLGQSGFLLRGAGATVCLDPFLSDMPGRVARSIVAAADMEGVDVFYGSHDHPDHIDKAAWQTLGRKNPGALFIVPGLLRERLAQETGLPVERFLGLEDGRTLRVGDLRFTGVASAHEFLDARDGRFPYMGCVLEMEGTRLYHPGDTCLYEGLAEKLRCAGPLDAMLLPINGRDGARYQSGILGNMTFQEAADLAGLLCPHLAVPTHYDMFQGNLEDPENFTRYLRAKYPKQRFWIGKIGEYTTLPEGSGLDG